MRGERPKVLFIASWYPTKENPANGIFIEKHAKAAARFADIAVLYVATQKDATDQVCTVEKKDDDGIMTVQVFSKPIKPHIPFVSELLKKLLYIKGGFHGFKAIKEAWGIPQITHVNVTYPAGVIALLLNIFKRVPYVVTEHWTGYTEQSGVFRDSSFILKRLTRLILEKAYAVTAVSRKLVYSIAGHGIKYRRAFIVPNVVDDPLLYESKKQKGSIVRVITISLLNNIQKNITGLIEAFACIAKRHKNIELHILGDGKDRVMLENLAERYGLLNKSIFFQGYVPNYELGKWFARADFFVLNSDYETFSVATAEALMHGVPVVVTKCGGPEEFVTTEVGIVVEKENKGSLVSSLEFMMLNYDKYDPEVLHEYAWGLFNPETVGRRFLEIYKSILKMKWTS